MTEFAFDGNAAVKMSAVEAPFGEAPAKEEKKTADPRAAKADGARTDNTAPNSGPRAKGGWVAATKAVATILCLAVCVVLILVSSAQLVMANDEVVNLRSQLAALEKEETKLMAQYELAYDLQEIEQQMLASGQMNKIQGWQTYTLELSEPDTVEYYQGWDMGEALSSFLGSLGTTMKEYFSLPVS